MTPDEEEIQELRGLYWGMLRFANARAHIVPDLPADPDGRTPRVKPQDLRRIQNTVWENPSLLDDYVKEHPEFNADQELFVRDRKAHLTGEFLVERLHRTNAIFIHAETQEVYQVLPLLTPWKDLFGMLQLPVRIRTTLIPYRYFIFCDGICEPVQGACGAGVRKYCKDLYLQARTEHRVHLCL